MSELARVSGIFRTGVSEVDGAMVLLPIERVRKTLHYDPISKRSCSKNR